MKELFKTRSYEMVRMFLNQFATAIFSLVLALAAGRAESVALRNVTSTCAIVFYLFLLYTMTWELGFADRAAVELGRKPAKPWTGVLLSVCANFINWLLAICIMLGNFLSDIPFFSGLGGISATITHVVEGMYTGLLANSVGGNPLNSYWWLYFLLPIPAIATCGISYFLGLKDIKCTGLFNVRYPDSDRDIKKKKKK